MEDIGPMREKNRDYTVQYWDYLEKLSVWANALLDYDINRAQHAVDGKAARLFIKK